jgi:hypothetical protein
MSTSLTLTTVSLNTISFNNRCDGLSRCDPNTARGLPCGGNVTVEQVMEVKMFRAIKVLLVAVMLVLGFASFSLGTISPAQALPTGPVDPE